MIWPWYWDNYAFEIFVHLVIWGIVVVLVDNGVSFIEGDRDWLRVVGALMLVLACIICYGAIWPGFKEVLYQWAKAVW
jgi:hypothetical protein